MGPRMLPPRPLLAAAVLLVGGLAWSVAVLPPPVASLAEAARWDGQAVTLEGWARDVRVDATGLRFTLVDGGHQVAVRVATTDAAAEPSPVSGDRVQASGRLGRWQGQLRLDVEASDALRIVPGARLATPTWSEVTADPAAWEGTPILLRGEVDRGHLREGSRSIALGDGAWPSGGSVQARALLRHDPSCLCHRLDAREVWPWTP